MPLAKTLYKEAQFAHAGLQFIAGNFTMNGSSQPDAAEGKPFAEAGTDLVRSDTGDYTLTIPGVGAVDILACFFQLEDDTDAILTQVVGRDDAARTIDLTFLDATDGATPVDPTDGQFLHCIIILKSRQL